MMAKTKGKYQTSFSTYKEFERIFNSIPEEDRLEWAENLDPKLLWIQDSCDTDAVAHWLAKRNALPEKFITNKLLYAKGWWGRTVAHLLAARGVLPEKFILKGTRNFFRKKDDNGVTIARYIYDFIKEKNRWNLLTPTLLDTPYLSKNRCVITDYVVIDLSKMNDADLDAALSLMLPRTLLCLGKNTQKDTLREAIRKQLKLRDREMESEAFETSPDEEPDLYTGGQEGLYEAGKGSRRSAAAKKIRGDIDREMESEAFETSPDEEQDIHFEGQEDLYCGVRSDR